MTLHGEMLGHGEDGKQAALFLEGLLMAQVALVLARLGVPDLMAAGPRQVADLAAETGAHPDALGRVLAAAAVYGLVRKDDAGKYTLTGAVPQLLDRNQCPALRLRCAFFRAAIRALCPNPRNHSRDFLARCATPQKPPEIRAPAGIEAQIPHAVGGEPAAIAIPAKRRGSRRDDAKNRAICQTKPFGRRVRTFRRIARDWLNASIAFFERSQHFLT
jgi:hypothetical protein